MTLPALFERHPPPWKARRLIGMPDDNAHSWCVEDAAGHVVEGCVCEPVARLLAAAPGLVEALEGLMGDLATYGGMVSVEECNKARAALAALKEEANRG